MEFFHLIFLHKTYVNKLNLLKLLIFIFLLHANYPAQNNSLKIRVGVFDPDVEYNNPAISSSFKQWIEAIKKKSDYKPFNTAIIEDKFIQNRDEFYNLVINNSLDLIALSTWDYYKLKLTDKLVPILTASSSETEKKEKYYLVTYKNNSGDIKQCVNQQITIPYFTSSELSKSWLLVLLYEELGKTNFKTVSLVDSRQTDQKELLSIFFKKKGFAVVRETAYQTSVELNPQLKKNILVIASSNRFLHYFEAVRPGLDKSVADAIAKEATRLHTTVDGKQVMNLMKQARTYTITHEDFKETKELYDKYYKVFNK